MRMVATASTPASRRTIVVSVIIALRCQFAGGVVVTLPLRLTVPPFGPVVWLDQVALPVPVLVAVPVLVRVWPFGPVTLRLRVQLPSAPWVEIGRGACRARGGQSGSISVV